MSEIRFVADELVDEAAAATGFSDFGGLPYREGLEALCETYSRHVWDPAGRERCRGRLLELLCVRLRCEHALQTIPAIAEQAIERPLFVTGLPRSGTSALINLLAKAPENRGLLQWETRYPDPVPGAKPGEEDPRYRALVAELAAGRKAAEAAAAASKSNGGKAESANADAESAGGEAERSRASSRDLAHDPEFRKMHYIDADTPEECVLIHAYAFDGVQLGFEIMLEPYRSWLLARDLKPMYAYQKRLMQMLSWRSADNGRKRWVLKAPAHMWALEAIREVFPDAGFAWCHRHPAPVTASINSMNRLVMGIFAGDCSHIDSREMGRAVMDWYAMSLERGLESRAGMSDALFEDCSQAGISSEPMQVVEGIYRRFGFELADDSRAAVRRYVDANPKGKHGKHEYDLASYGLTDADVRERFKFYLEDGRFPISD